MTSVDRLQEVEGEEAEGRDTCPSHTLPVEKKRNTHTHKSGLETPQSKLLLNKNVTHLRLQQVLLVSKHETILKGYFEKTKV